MPEIFRMLGFRFFFYANDHEPIHVHVENANGEAKFNIDDKKITLIFSFGMKKKDLKIAQSLIEENRNIIINYWIKFFEQ